MKQLRLATALVLALCAARPAEAITIQFLATDLTDSLSGQDLWEYQFFVSDFDVMTNQGFSIFFDHTLYTDLQDPAPTVDADWDGLVFQPDVALTSDGIYDALAFADNASLANPFVLTFTWLGVPGASPGSQPFTVNQFDADGNLLAILEEGFTVPFAAPTGVPEPSTILLIGIGGAGLWHRHRRRQPMH